MVKVAITGGTSGVGFEACKQLCAVAEVTGVVLTSRSSANAEKAIERLRSATGKDGSFFEYVVLDLEDLPSIVAAISSFPKVDRICLNGSRLGKCKLHAQSMVTDAMASVLGHTVLTDGLVAAGKLNAGARIVHIGGEIARPLWSFIGLLPNFFSFAEATSTRPTPKTTPTAAAAFRFACSSATTRTPRSSARSSTRDWRRSSRTSM